MSDPKYKFTDQGVFHRTGNYFLPDDEPLMLFRGKDELAVKMVELYLNELEKQPKTEIVISHIETARERLKAFKEFHEKNPDRVGVCCSTEQKAVK